MLNLHSKLISLLSFFCFKLFIYPPDVKRPKVSTGFTPWTLTWALPWTLCGVYSTSRPPTAFYNIQKLNLCSKTDISETASINDYQNIQVFNQAMIYQIYDVMMSVSTWDWVHFWIYLLNHNSLSHQMWPNDRYRLITRNLLNNLEDWGQVPCHFQISYSMTNYVKIPAFHFLKR